MSGFNKCWVRVLRTVRNSVHATLWKILKREFTEIADQTDAERKLWQRINRDQLLGFRFNRQKPLLSYIVDFYCAKARLIIELDGSQHYEPDYQEKDAFRDAELNSLGFTVMRFSNDEVRCEIEAVVEQIYLFLENVRADWVWGRINFCQISPNPSLLKRGILE